MPDVFFPITEIASNILDPLISQISEAVLARLGVRQYFPDSIYYLTNRSASSISGDGNGNINLIRNRCDVTVEDILNSANVTWDTSTFNNQTAYGVSPQYRNQYQNIFYDPTAYTTILEHTMPSALFFTFKLRFLSFDAAQLAFAALLSQNHGTVVTMTHDVVYGYPITLHMVMALIAIYEARKSFVGTFNTYLSTYSTVDWHSNVRKLDLGTTPMETQLTVQKQQLRCQALLEFSQNEPEVERIGGLAQYYTIDFSYKVQFGRPNALQLVLPCAVENNVLPEVLFCKTQLNAVDFLQSVLQEKSFAQFMSEQVNYLPPPLMTMLPSYDDFIPTRNSMLVTAKYHSFVSAAFTLDIPSPTIINFTILGPYQLHPTVIAIINLHSSDDLLGYQGLFNLTIYANEYPLDTSLITVDTATLTVTIAATVLAKNYRLVLSEATDLNWVLPKWYPTLLQYRFFFPMTIERNLNILLNNNVVQITADLALIGLVNTLMKKNQLDAIIKAWIAAGETSYLIFGYTQTARQFADYISLTEASVTVNSTLYDLFIAACIAANYITAALPPPSRSLRTPTGYPYGQGQGGFNAFNLPLRIFNVSLEPKYTTG